MENPAKQRPRRQSTAVETEGNHTADTNKVKKLSLVTPDGQTVAIDPRLFSGATPGIGDQLHPRESDPLDILEKVDCIYLEEKRDSLECCADCACMEKKYKIFDHTGQFIFYSEEDSCCCTRVLCGGRRSFEMSIREAHDKEIIHLTRPMNCSSSFICCCLDRVDVYFPPDKLAGSVEKRFSMVASKYFVWTADGKIRFTIKGPWCTKSCWCCNRNVSFKIYNNAGDQIGRIAKRDQWARPMGPDYAGLFQQPSENTPNKPLNNFGISFPANLDLENKSLLLGAAILIEYTYFEGEEAKRERKRRRLESLKENEAPHPPPLASSQQ